jgi:hypothetical protein
MNNFVKLMWFIMDIKEKDYLQGCVWLALSIIITIEVIMNWVKKENQI